MIINKEQIDSVNEQGQPCKQLVISYVNRDGGISYLKWNIPESEMFKWVYTTRQHADPPFQAVDRATGVPQFNEDGTPKVVQWMSYDNKYIKRQPCRELPDMRVNEIINYFGKNLDPLFEMNVPVTWFCDIETDVTADGFPDAESARNPVNTISLTRFPETIIFARKPLTDEQIANIQKRIDTYSPITKGYKFTYKYYESEIQMMHAFLEFVKPIPALTGWNFLGYDWLYIHNRCKKLNLDIEGLSPTRRIEPFKLNRKVVINTPVPLHKIIYDYLIVYKSWDRTVEVKENDKLDFVADKVLGIKKVEHQWGFEEFYRDHYEDYVFYNAIDTILVEKIDEKIKTAQIWYMLACELRLELNTAFSTIKPTETVMCNFIYPHYKVLPEKPKNKESVEADYEGAFVWPTQPGIYKMIGGLDFASLYPSIIRQFQISPETFLFKDPNYKPKEDEIKCCSGAVYRKSPDAIIPAILTHYFALRKAAKKDKKTCDQLKEDYTKILHQRKNVGQVGAEMPKKTDIAKPC